MHASLRASVLAGFVAVLVLSAAQDGLAQGRGRGGMRTPQNLMTLAGHELVQKELGVSAEQAAKLKTVTEAYGAEMASEMQKLGFNFQEVSALEPAERTKKMNEFRQKTTEIGKKMLEKFRPQIVEILKEKQAERLQQILVQASGPEAFSLPEVVKALALSKEQQEKIASIGKQHGDKMMGLFGGGGGNVDFAEIGQKMQALNEEREKAIADVVTKAQMEKMESLKGEPFDLAQLQPPFGGGFGGGRPSPAGRPGKKAEGPATKEKSDK
jgi:hypothetical protein